jgi:hypothetical protein
VRPFGSVRPIGDKLFFTTGNKKSVYKQLVANPKIEICAYGKDGATLRFSGLAVAEEGEEEKNAFFASMGARAPSNRESEGESVVFSITQAKGVIRYGDGQIQDFEL